MKSTSARVPRFDYLQQYQALRREILAAVDRVFQSGQLILGPEVEAFEADMCRFLGGAGHAVGVGNGTDALAIALRALGLGPGDEVITVSNTAVATVSAIRMAGATPVFCDVDPQTLLMDPADAAQRISGKTRAILPVHLFGNAVDMKAILRLAQRHRLRVIEDCAIVRHAPRRPGHGHVGRRGLLFVLSDEEPGGLRRRRTVFHARRGSGRLDPLHSLLWLRPGRGEPVRRGQQPAG